MKMRKGFNRRSFMERVTGGVLLSSSSMTALVGDVFAFQSGCSDADPSDPLGNGRNCSGGGGGHSDQANQPTVGTYSGCTDSDSGAGYDRPGYGRRCTSAGTTQNQPTVGTYSGCTDSDSGAGYDRPGYGRRCTTGTPAPPPPPPPPSGNQTYTGCTDSDSGANYDRPSYGRNCTRTTDPGATGNQTYTGCSDSDSGPNFDRAGYGRNCTPTGGAGGQEAQIRAWLDPDCVPLNITISELPSRSCTINIAGFRRNTADPVEVVLPNAVDGFGNHANGIQINFAGQAQTYDWPDTYRWGIFVFACPGQRGTGANCYNSVTAPGTTTVPIIVRQRGAGQATVMLQVNARGGAGGGLQFPNAVRIENLWRRNNFLNVENGLAVTPILPQWESALWWIEAAQDFPGFVRIRSRWQQTWFLHIENGRLECSPIQNYWHSALWALETPRGGNLVRIRNKWRPEQYINIENGLQSSPAPPQWDSSYWIIQ